ncbi:MAG: DNA repair protein RadC [Thermomicrobiales bacterium]
MSDWTVRPLRIKELPSDERPREKLTSHGPSALSNAELLAILVNTGSRGESVTSLCQRILQESGGGLRGLMKRDLDSLTEIHGVGPAKAVTILAAIELGRRIAQLSPEERTQIRNPEDLARIFEPRLTALDHEQLWVAVLDTKHRLERMVAVYQGSVNSAQVRTAEVFKEAIRANAPAIALAHNHPSGDPTPSADDIALTADLERAARILDIDLIDHLVIGDGRWLSLRRLGLGFSSGGS